MRLFFYLIWIILIIIGASFAMLNSHDVAFNYLMGQKTVYFPLLFLGILFAGALLGVIALMPRIIKLKTQIYLLNQKMK